MNATNIILLSLVTIGSGFLIRRIEKERFKRKYKLGNKREYYIYPWFVLVIAIIQINHLI